jgi:hypothetical protein
LGKFGRINGCIRQASTGATAALVRHSVGSSATQRSHYQFDRDDGGTRNPELRYRNRSSHGRNCCRRSLGPTKKIERIHRRF